MGRGAPELSGHGGTEAILALQRTAGNRAVSSLVAPVVQRATADNDQGSFRATYTPGTKDYSVSAKFGTAWQPLGASRVPDGLRITRVVWSGNEGLIYAKGKANTKPSILRFDGNKPTDKPTPLLSGAKGLSSGDRSTVKSIKGSSDVQKAEKRSFKARETFLDQVQGATTPAEVAARIYDNVRSSGIIYSTSGVVNAQMLLAGAVSFGACHHIASTLLHTTNAAIAALGLGNGDEAKLRTVSDPLLTHDQPSNLLGHPAGVTDIVDHVDSSGNQLAKTHRIVFSSHTWVEVAGKVFDAVAGIRDGGASAVDQTLRPTGGGGYENANYTVTMLPGAPTPGFTGRYRLAEK